MGGLEAVITGLMDEFTLNNMKRETFTAIVLFTSFLGCLVNCTQGGGYSMYWFDNYSAGISLLWWASASSFPRVSIVIVSETFFQFCVIRGNRPSYLWHWQILWWHWKHDWFQTQHLLEDLLEVYLSYLLALYRHICLLFFGKSYLPRIPVSSLVHSIRLDSQSVFRCCHSCHGSRLWMQKKRK